MSIFPFIRVIFNTIQTIIQQLMLNHNNRKHTMFQSLLMPIQLAQYRTQIKVSIRQRNMI